MAPRHNAANDSGARSDTSRCCREVPPACGAAAPSLGPSSEHEPNVCQPRCPGAEGGLRERGSVCSQGRLKSQPGVREVACCQVMCQTKHLCPVALPVESGNEGRASARMGSGS